VNGTDEQDPMNEKMALVKAAMERIRSGASTEEEVEVPSGGRVRVVRDDNVPSGIRVEVLEDGQGAEGPSEADADRAEMMERMKAASQRVRSGEAEVEELTLSGGEVVRISMDSEIAGAFSVESHREGSRFLAQTIEAPEEMPSGYPEDLPFVPGASVSISTISPADGSTAPRTVAWMNPPDVDAALAAIKSSLQNSGWGKGEKSVGATLHGPTTSWTFSRGQDTRQLIVMAFGPVSQILMVEKGAGSP